MQLVRFDEQFDRKTKTIMTVRAATIQDAKLIAQFNQAMAMETESKALDWGTISAGVERMLLNPELGFYLVFEQGTGGQISGCLGITFEWSDWRNGLFWWIQSVYVSPDSREQGVFTAMYHEVQKLAREVPEIIGIRLYAERENQRALRAYYGLGMHETDYKLLQYLIDN